MSFATFAAINKNHVLATSVKFTTTLTTSLITGNKVKIDYGKGLMAMTCTNKICTLSSKSLPSSLSSNSIPVPIVYKIGIYNAHNVLQSNLQTGTYVLIDNVKAILEPVTASPISNFQVDGTAFKFTTTLSTPLTKGYKVKIDYGKGLAVMSCSGEICILSANIALTKASSHTYKVAIYNAKNQLQDTEFTNNYIFSGIAIPFLNSTVVIRIVGTNPEWGQESEPGWLRASPVKSADGYQLYDLEIGRARPPKDIAKYFQSDGSVTEISSLIPAYVTLYKFPNESLDKKASTIRSIPVESIDNSSQTAEALKNLVSLVLDKENPTRIVIAYSGHGSPWTMFEGDITLDEGAELFDSIRLKKPGIPLILDFSTNCDVGYFDFAVRYINHADYLLASDKPVGGFSPNISSWQGGSPEEIAYNAANHDYNYDKFFKASNSIDQAFDDIIATRQKNWLLGSNSIKANAIEQSLSIYQFSEFDNLMHALKVNRLNPLLDLPKNSNDIATYVYQTKKKTLISTLEKFRIRYASDRNLLNWVDNSLGFSVYFTTDLQTYLNTH